MTKIYAKQIGDNDHPGSLKDIMTVPPLSLTDMARIHKTHTENRRKVEDKILERALGGQDVL